MNTSQLARKWHWNCWSIIYYQNEFYQNQHQHLSCNMRFSILSYVRPAKAQTSLRIHAVWSEPLLYAWIFYEYYATNWTSFGVSKLKRRLHRLVWAYSCQNGTLMEISCRGSFLFVLGKLKSQLNQLAREWHWGCWSIISTEDDQWDTYHHGIGKSLFNHGISSKPTYNKNQDGHSWYILRGHLL